MIKLLIYIRQLRYNILVITSMLAAIITPISIAHSELIDRVVAEVNEDVITLSEVNEEGETFIRRIITEVPAEDREMALQQAYSDILDGLIDKLLITQEAAKQGIVVTDEEIEAAINRIISLSNLSREAFFAELENKGVNEETYLSNIQSQIYQNKIVTRNISSKIIITEEMILDYYDNTYTRRVEEGGYYLLQIGMDWGDGETDLDSAALQKNKQDALQRAERVHKLALTGQDFKELARKFSDLPSAADGGDIGIFHQDDMASYMKKAVLTLEPGSVSPIIESPVGYQFFKLLSNREGGIVMQAPYDSVKEEIREELYNQAMQEAFVNWIDEMKTKSYIKKLL